MIFGVILYNLLNRYLLILIDYLFINKKESFPESRRASKRGSLMTSHNVASNCDI